MSTETITASEYLDAENEAARNGADIPAFTRIKEELLQRPRERARLTFDFLALAWQALERRAPGLSHLFHLATCFPGGVAGERMPEYVAWMEKFALRCSDLLGEAKLQTEAQTEVEIALLSALLRLRHADQARFHAASAALRGRGGAGDQSPILDAVALAEASEAQLKGRLGEAGKKVALFEAE